MKTAKRPYFTVGCYLEHGCRNPTELLEDIIAMAEGEGFAPEEPAPDDEESDDYRDWLEWEADRAEQFLNDHEKTPPCAYWANDGEAGAFGLWPSIEIAREDADLVVDGRSEVPEGFNGTVFRVNDHGNVGFYRAENGSCVEEFWSCV